MRGHKPASSREKEEEIVIHGARCAAGPRKSTFASIRITGGRITHILSRSSFSYSYVPGCAEIDLSGFLVMPGLINAHDHLEFALFPRLADPPYCSYIDWGEDIHNKFTNVIAKHHAVPKDVRVWWGGIRNLLCGVTTVSHHNPLHQEMRRNEFPVRVVQEYGWAHSPALGGNLQTARAATPDGHAFIVHAGEGVDELARQELWKLDQLEVLDSAAVLVHGLAIDQQGAALMVERRASLIVCPSSNMFLFGMLPKISLLSAIENLALGSDSPLTAEGDLLDEIRFAIHCCGVSPQDVFRMVTTAPAAVLRLTDSEGSISESGVGDLIAVRDTGEDAADRLQTLLMNDIEFVMIGGRVQLASEAILERLSLSAKHGLEPLSVDGTIRWLRAPVTELLTRAEQVLGIGQVQLGTRAVCIPKCAESEYVR